MAHKKIEKILLIRPSPKTEQFGDESFLPLGLAYIAAVLEKRGYKVRVIDPLIQKIDDAGLFQQIQEFNPDIIGFTAVTPVINSAYKIAKQIKERYADITTIIGGPHATALPEECLENNIDYVVRCEGEETIIDLLSNLNKPEKVDGISFKKNGKIIHNKKREFIKNLDELPFPARHLFPPLEKYRGQEALGSLIPVGSIMTSRGCPYACKFCFKAVFGNRFRPRSAESVIAEWIHLINIHNVKEIAVVDDSFTTDTGRVHKICDGLIKAGLKKRWSCPNGIRVDLGDYDMLSKMRRAGCYRVALGIESGSQKILDTIGKKITLEQIEKTVKNCRRAGIKTMGFYMLGNLGETRETMEETIRFAKKINTDYAQFLIAIPYPGTVLYDEILKNGKLYINDWDQYGQYEGSACFEYQNLNPSLLAEMSKKAEKDYYLSPAYILRQILNTETYRFLPRRIKAALRVVFK